MTSAINPHRCQHEPYADVMLETIGHMWSLVDVRLRIRFTPLATADWRCAKCGKRLKRPVWRVRGSM